MSQTLTIANLIKLGVLLLGAVALLLLFRRRARRLQRHLAGKVAATTADEAGHYALGYRAPQSAGYLLYMHYQIQNRGTEDDYGLRCQLEASTESGPTLVRDLGILGPLQNPPPLQYEERARGTFDGSMVSGGIGYRHSGRVELAEMRLAEGEELTVQGKITPNELSRVDAIEVYLVPATLRLGGSASSTSER